jgi:anti-sigma factor RsiW
MKCEEFRELILDAMEGSLPAANAAEWEQHRAACAACAEEWRALKATSALLDEWHAPEPSPYFDVRLQANLRAEKERPASAWRAWLGLHPSRSFAVGTLAVLIAAGVGLYQFGGNHAANGPQVMEQKEGTAVSDLKALDKDADVYAAVDNLADDQNPND